ncbi:MFS transporter [Ktedonospora formicarum]|uniref:MFS transporter n=1 Tax=Ktedonospora formicarum TaxID=2778364 RepID=A0A8J3I781_9CHLR|nr:MFS transporter [Ktedonospora formicarum]GHO47088.1 MFS transporter [Ktedonospora formicarum]
MRGLAVPVSLQIRGYRHLMVASLISNTGGWGQSVAVGVVAYHDHNWWALYLGSLVPTFLPRALMGPWSGWFADRFPRRQVIIYALSIQLIDALVFWWLKATRDDLRVVEMFTLITISSICNTVINVARQALVKEMVPFDSLSNALSVNGLNVRVGQALGSSLGGVLSTPDKQSWLFLGNAISYLPVLYVMYRLKDFGREKPVRQCEPVRMREALKYVAREQETRRALIVVVLMTVCMSGDVANPPIGQALGGPRAYALVLAAGGVGSVLAALIQSVLKERRKPTLSGLLGWSALMSFPVAVYSSTSSLPVAMACLGMAYACGNVSTVLSNVLVVGRAPREKSGRVGAIYQMTMQCSTLFSGLVTYLVLDHVEAGVRVIFTTINLIGMAVLCVWWALETPRLRLALSSSCLLWVLHTPGLRRDRQP